MMEVEDYCNPSSVQTFLNNDCDGHSLSIERNAKDVPLTRSTQSLSTLYSSLEASVCASTLCLEGLDSKSSIYSDQNASSPSLKAVEFAIQPIVSRPLSLRQNYYLIGDIAIDFDLLRGKESRFSPLADFRPVVSVERDIFSGFMEVQMGQRGTPMRDFRCVIAQLNSMQDQFARGIAVLLDKYQKLVDFKVRMEKSVTWKKTEGSFDVDNFYQIAKIKAKEVLNEKSKESKYLAYFIKRGAYLDSKMTCQGASEQLLEVLGLDAELFRSVSLRRGLLDFVDPLRRYFIIIEAFADVAKRQMPWEQVHLISIDNFKIPVRVRAEKILLNKRQCYENTLLLLHIDIEESVVNDLQIRRHRAQRFIKNPAYLSLGEELTYSLESEVFLQYFYKNERKAMITEEDEEAQSF